FLSTELTRPQQFGPDGRENFDRIFNLYARIAVESYETGGSAALDAYLRRMRDESRVDANLFNDAGEQLDDNPETNGARNAAVQTLRNVQKPFGPPPHGRNHVIVRSLFGRDGHRYVLVLEAPFGPPPEHSWTTYVSRLLALLLTGGLLCYGLARYMTSPVTKLRTVTNRLAS